MQRNLPSKIVAAFDFDKTLIDRDSLVPFFFYTTKRCKALYYFIKAFPFYLGYSCDCISREEIKEKLLRYFFKNKSLQDLQEIGEKYAKERLDNYLKPEALSCLRWHQEQGHYCVLISASLNIYLSPWAKEKGFHEVIASHLEKNTDNLITGKLQGGNCWGEEKKRRLLASLGPKEKFVLYMYGDSKGDLPLLELADYPFYRLF